MSSSDITTLCDALDAFGATSDQSKRYPRRIKGRFELYDVVGLATTSPTQATAATIDDPAELAIGPEVELGTVVYESIIKYVADAALRDTDEMDTTTGDVIMEDADHDDGSDLDMYSNDACSSEGDVSDTSSRRIFDGIRCGEDSEAGKSYPLFDKWFPRESEVPFPNRYTNKPLDSSVGTKNLPEFILSDGSAIRPRYILVSGEASSLQTAQYHCYEQDGAEQDEIIVDQVLLNRPADDASQIVFSSVRDEKSTPTSTVTIPANAWERPYDDESREWYDNSGDGVCTTGIKWNRWAEDFGADTHKFKMSIIHFIPKGDAGEEEGPQ